MITATVLAVFFVPVFFVVVRSIFKGSERQRRKYAHEDDARRPRRGRSRKRRQGSAMMAGPQLWHQPDRRCAGARPGDDAGRLRDHDPPLRAPGGADCAGLPACAGCPDARRRSGERHRMAKLLRRRAPEAPDRHCAEEQPRPAHSGAQHRTGARRSTRYGAPICSPPSASAPAVRASPSATAASSAPTRSACPSPPTSSTSSAACAA